MNAVHDHRFVRRNVACLAAALMTLALFGCTAQLPSGGDDTPPDTSNENTNGNDNSSGGSDEDDTGGDDANGDTGTGDSEGDDTGDGETGDDEADDGDEETAAVSGTYQPATGLHLEAENITLDIPPGALAVPTDITLTPAADVTLPAVIPGASALAGARFSPNGLVFGLPAMVAARLIRQTIAPALPVITFDVTKNRWVGTGAVGFIAPNGFDVTFELEHFSIAGIPDGTPVPGPGDPIGSLLAVSNTGTFTSDEISSNMASMVYSDFGATFGISLFSQEMTGRGQIETKSLGLSSIQVTRVGNYIVGVVGGGDSLFNGGSFNESAVGVMIMSLIDDQVWMSVYVATSERVISGTLTGTP